MLTQQRGMTPTELVVVIVLVAILAVVAVPSYQSSVQKSRRTDAKTALITSAQAMERVFTQTNTYANVTAGTNGNCNPAYLCTAGPGYDGPTGLGTPNGTGAF